MTHKVDNAEGEYWSTASKKNLVQKLGEVEHKAVKLCAELCDRYCMYPEVVRNQDALDRKCEACPMNDLLGLIDV